MPRVTLNAQKTNFRQGGGFEGVRSGRTSVKKLLPPQAIRGIWLGLLINCGPLPVTDSSDDFYRLPISPSYFLHSLRPGYRASLKISFILSLTSPSSSFSSPSSYFSSSYACQFLNISVIFPPLPHILRLSIVYSFFFTASYSWFHQFKPYLHLFLSSLYKLTCSTPRTDVILPSPRNIPKSSSDWVPTTAPIFR
jgi:hypothetical protein